MSAKLHRRSVHAEWPTRQLRARRSEKGATLRVQVVFPPKRTYIINMDAAPQKAPVKLARVRILHG